ELVDHRQPVLRRCRWTTRPEPHPCGLHRPRLGSRAFHRALATRGGKSRAPITPSPTTLAALLNLEIRSVCLRFPAFPAPPLKAFSAHATSTTASPRRGRAKLSVDLYKWRVI